MGEDGEEIGARPLVMLFDETSMRDAGAIRRLTAIVRAHAARRLVVVVSALSGVTDELSALADEAYGGEVTRAMELRVSALVDRHGVIGDAVVAGAGLDSLHAELATALREIPLLLEVIAAHPDTRRPLRDELLSWGERLSSHVVAAALQTAGLPGRWVDARQCIRTDGEHGRAEPLPDATREACRAVLGPALAAGEVPVLGGAVGATTVGATTVGRDGSGPAAALVAAALDAAEIQAWTDDGDDRMPHPHALHVAAQHGIRIRICDFREPGGALSGCARPRRST